jgi:putative ABC transport system ATP-binding protein
VVTCDGVSVVYRAAAGELEVLTDVTCSIQPGGLIGVIGPSGSGKTTLLHVLAGLERPRSGRVSWPAIGASPAERVGRVSLAFQSPSLLTALDVTENVALPLVLSGMEEGFALDRACTTLGQLGLAELARQLPEELSGGQAQRVGLARALVSEPALLLCDEPTGQVDHQTASILLDVLLGEALKHNTAVVMATHDAAVIDRLHACWSISDGRLSPFASPNSDGIER